MKLPRWTKLLKYRVGFDEESSAHSLKPKFQLYTVMFPGKFVALVLYILPALAAPSPLVSVKKTRDAVPGRYIVTFKNDVNRVAGISSIAKKISPQSEVTHEWDIINGFAGTFTDDDLELLRSNPDVASIEEDGYAHTQAVTTQ